jgi:RIO kinase 1
MVQKNLAHYNLDEYEDTTDPLSADRQSRRKRKPKARHIPKKSQSEILAEIAAVDALEDKSFKTTYVPSKYEATWLLESLHAFYQQEYIVDVLAQVRGGKEASVYCCKAHPSLPDRPAVLAAKVYRPRQFRQLRNDALYREGRDIMTLDGGVVGPRDHRTWRALAKKTGYGAEIAHQSWLMHEYNTLQLLHQAGAAVPKPYATSENAILMQLIGDEAQAAPTLSAVHIEREEAESLFQEVLRNIDLMLQHGFIHGDLSAYNLLYWEGEITLIDFPQVTDSRFNTQARFILQRDVERVCAYFAAHGVKTDPARLVNQMWHKHIEGNVNVQADISRRTQEQIERHFTPDESDE